MSIRYVHVVCAESDCGAEVDRIEYDEDAIAPAVQAVMDSLDLDQAAATKLVAEHNPGAELSSKQSAHALAEQIVNKTVADRDAWTYDCPRGHDGGLKITDDPEPLALTALRMAEQPTPEPAHAAPDATEGV